MRETTQWSAGTHLRRRSQGQLVFTPLVYIVVLEPMLCRTCADMVAFFVQVPVQSSGVHVNGYAYANACTHVSGGVSANYTYPLAICTCQLATCTSRHLLYTCILSTYTCPKPPTPVCFPPVPPGTYCTTVSSPRTPVPSHLHRFASHLHLPAPGCTRPTIFPVPSYCKRIHNCSKDMSCHDNAKFFLTI